MKPIRILPALIPFLFLAAGCRQDGISVQNTENGIMEITAYCAESDGKTVLADDATSVLWSPNDEISMFFNSASVKFTSLNTEPAAWTVFQSEKALVFGGSEGSDKPYLYGVYPYSTNNQQVKDTLVLSVPSSQVAEEGTFNRGSFPSVGRSKTTDIAFYNVCGGLRFTVEGEGITRVSFSGNNDEYLAGKVKVIFDEDGHPAVREVADGVKTVTLAKASGEYFKAGEWYYISMLPAVLSKGFTINLYKGSDKAELKVDSAKEIKRSRFGELKEIDKGLIFKTGVSKITLNKTQLNLQPMTAAQLTYTVYPENAEYEWIKWESSDKTIAKVDDDGLVTMLKSGSCTITVSSDNGVSSACEVKSNFILINVSAISFGANEFLTYEVSIISTIDWKVKNPPSWASFTVNGVDATKEYIPASPVKMIVSVEMNVGETRGCNVIIYGADDVQENLTITQNGMDPSETESKTIVEFISLADSKSYYRLTGTVSGFNSTYCSFDLTDASGSIYVYSVTEESKTKYASVIKDGGTITLTGKYSYYASKSQHEVVDAIILNFKEGEVVDPTKAESKTVKEFINKADKTIYYKLSGTVSGFNSTYCSFDLTDASGSIYVYNVTEESKTKYASVIKDGGMVTLSGKYSYYVSKSQHEVVDAVILDYKAGANSYITVSPTSLKVPCSESVKTINVQSNVNWTISSDKAFVTFDKTSGSGDGTITITCQENKDFTAGRTALITVSTSAEVAVKTYEITLQQDAAIDPSLPCMQLTNDEITAALANYLPASAITNYTDVEISSNSGKWIGNMCVSKSTDGKLSSPYIQLRSKSGAKLLSPTFSQDIDRIILSINIKTPSRTLYAVPSDTKIPDTTYDKSLYDTNFGYIKTTGGSAEEVTIMVSGFHKDFILVAEGGAVYIDSIKVYLKK